MLYFKRLGSQRGIAWRWAGSLSLRELSRLAFVVIGARGVRGHAALAASSESFIGINLGLIACMIARLIRYMNEAATNITL